jgi:hypothetical protein
VSARRKASRAARVETEIAERTIVERAEGERGHVNFEIAEDGHIVHAELMEGAQNSPAAGEVAEVAVDDAREDGFHNFCFTAKPAKKNLLYCLRGLRMLCG